MRAIVQRVTSAKVLVRDSGSAQRIDSGYPQGVAGGCIVPPSGSGDPQACAGGEIAHGLCLLVGVHKDDTEANAKRLAEKITTLRIFNDNEGKMNHSLQDNPGYDVLAVSNFTVYGDTKKNRRPSFAESAPYEMGKDLFDKFVHHLRTQASSAPPESSEPTWK